MYKYDRDAIQVTHQLLFIFSIWTFFQERPIERQIHPFILARRSMKHMNGKPVDHEDLMSLFEAARWAPSAYNLQEWRFVYAERDGPYWDRFFELLTDRNQQWAKDAGVLVVVLSSKYEKYRGHKLPVATHSFDAGAAWMAMALEGTARGLVVHATGGYDSQKVAEVIGLNSDDYQVEAILAIGNRALKGKPENTTQRLDVSKFVFDGIFEEK